MGTFTHYYGPKQLIREKKDEFVERALKILRYGGAMGVEPMQLSGEWVFLVKPLDLEDYGYDFTYSYFERSLWEDVVLNPQTGAFGTNKVGYSYFGQVCFAVNLLREFYAVVPGVTSLNGTNPMVEHCIGWLNTLFDEHWDNSRLYRIQRLYRRFPDWLDDFYDCENNPDAKKIIECLAEPVKASGKIDPKIFEKMKEDGVASDYNDVAVDPVTTVEFLNLASYIPRYFSEDPHTMGVTNDDRALWWEPGGEVVFSEDMQKWLKAIRNLYEHLTQDEEEIAIRSTLLNILEESTKKYHRPFLFSSFFWEFIDHPQDRHVQTATKLLKNLLGIASPMLLDRYCAVLANETLRREVLGF